MDLMGGYAEKKRQEDKRMKFYKLEGKIVIGGNEGEEVIPNTTDGAYEKHVPVIEQQGEHVIVKIGAVEHPMLPAHYIEWIVLETATGYQKKDLNPSEKPVADFVVTEPIIAAYEYCNLHGLWVAKA